MDLKDAVKKVLADAGNRARQHYEQEEKLRQQGMLVNRVRAALDRSRERTDMAPHGAVQQRRFRDIASVLHGEAAPTPEELSPVPQISVPDLRELSSG